MLTVGVLPFINLVSVMPIKSNSIWSWLIKYLRLSNCLGRNKHLLGEIKNELCFLYFWLYD